jgi:4-hydroxybenzoyl-CoA thioesterase
MAFRTQIDVRFGDVDHAGIVYYPKFFIYFHEAFEDFFNNGGHRYSALLNQRRIGFPTVHIEADYQQPLRYGDALDIEVTVPKVGNRSAVFRYVGFRHQDGQRACSADITCACVDLDHFQAVVIPDDLRQLFSQFST